LVKNRPCHRPKAVPAHFILVDAHPSHGRENCVVAHRSRVAARARKNKAPSSCDGLQFSQDFQGLFGEGDDMRGIGLSHGIAPFRSVQIDVRPFSLAKLTRAYEDQWRKTQGAAHRRRAFVAIHCSQDCSKLFWICSCRKVLALHRRECAAKSSCRIMRSASGGDSIAKYLPTVAQGTMCGFQCTPAFDSAHHGQRFGCSYIDSRPAADPREDVALKEPNDSVAVHHGPGRGILSKPLPRHYLETVRRTVGVGQFLCLGFSLGSMPLASSLRAASRRSRASFRLTSGYTPRDSRFSLLSNRNFNRHHFPPVGETSRYSPRSSKSLTLFWEGLALRSAVSVSGMGATPFWNNSLAPNVAPRCQWMVLFFPGTKAREKPVFTGP